MEDIIKKPYEVSLWEDKLTYVTLKGEFTGSIPEDSGPILGQYYKEYKIAIIGSNSMTSPIRTINNVLKSNINGTNTFTFSIYSHYYDEETNELIDNPFKKLLVNERKVKLRYGAPDDCKWYDFIIKEISEDSESMTYTYTAKDLFINELSKSGFNLEFDKKLENNMGNISTLADRILEESDWKLKGRLLLQQTKEEPVYKIQLAQKIDAKNIEDNAPLSLESGTFIYAFYSVIENKEPYFQFVYVPNDGYEKDDRLVLKNNKSNYVIDVTYEGKRIIYNGGFLTNQTDFAISSDFRAKKFVRKQVTKYDPTIDKYVKVYELDNAEVYGYTEHEYLSTNAIESYVTNPKDFTTTTGWKGGLTSEVTDLSAVPNLNIAMVPDIRDTSPSYSGEFISYLLFNKTLSSQILMNTGMVDYRTSINELVKDQVYIFRAKFGQVGEVAASGRPVTIVPSRAGFKVKIATYTQNNGGYTLKDVIFEGRVPPVASIEQYSQIELTCKKSYSYSDMLSLSNQIGIFFDFEQIGEYYFQDVQLFQKRLDGNNEVCLPETPLKAAVKTKYYYYKPNKDYKKLEDVQYLYKGDTPSSTFIPKFNIDSFEKVRMLDGSESNRFNLIQSLCEIFECWVTFEIDHKPNGEILIGKDRLDWEQLTQEQQEEEKYRQQKWVIFYEGANKVNDCGFKYGINLKAIKRKVESEQIVSKIIVKSNSNEFAKDGFCSIARSEENYARENFLIDFGYYIQQGLLNFNEVNNDLFSNKDNPQGYLGYYKGLRDYNITSQKIIEEQSLLATDIIKFESKVTTFKQQIEKTSNQLEQTYRLIKNTTGLTFDQLNKDKSNHWWEEKIVISNANLIGNLNHSLEVQNQLLVQTELQLKETKEKYETNKKVLKENILQKNKLHHNFYKKYSRFIQEGSWISEDYLDDNLYYFDAESTLHTSSQPKVSYTINVLELSNLPEYENYTFSLGEKSFIEDTKFFGWTYKEGIKTPFQEEIVITETSISLDSPELNTITVQNYKTQFEDLFQRITATTQSLEFSSGQYNKVSNIIDSKGQIKFDTLQNSISNNAFVIQNSRNQSVIWDETGITTTSVQAPNEIVRIVSGGIFITQDGGTSWNTGITGKGINANYITSGQLNTNQVNILNGAFPSFRWDSTGINAYSFEVNDQTGESQNFNYGKFIRLDQYGLYGINGNNKFDANVKDEDGTVGEEKIKKKSNFAVTWSGFQIKSNHKSGGYISITSDKDFRVVDQNDKARVLIGLLNDDQNDPVYGLRLMNNEGNPVLEQSSEGKLWLRKELNISSPDFQVSLGYLPGAKMDSKQQKQIHEIINANNSFIVYEDGSMEAKAGTFTGTINATGGTIGGISIDSFSSLEYEVVIESDTGAIFKNGKGTKILTAKLYKGKEEIPADKLTYKWYRQDTIIPNENKNTLQVEAANLNPDTDSAVYSCVVEIQEGAKGVK